MSIKNLKNRVDILTVIDTKKQEQGEILLPNVDLFIYSGVKQENTAAAEVGCII